MSSPNTTVEDQVCDASVGVHILVGKRRRHHHHQLESSDNPGRAQYDSVWVFVKRNQGTLSYGSFNAALMKEINNLAEQESEEGALTFFSPIGKYMSFCAEPFPVDVPEGIYVPPPTSIMTNKSTMGNNRRPIWIDFYVHSPPSSPTDSSIATEIRQQLRRLDTLLSSGPGGHNRLYLAEVPASTPNLTAALAVDSKDWACMMELFALLSMLNNASTPVQDLVTRFGFVSADNQPGVVMRNYSDFLCSLTRDMYFAWVSEGDLEAVLRSGGRDEYFGLPVGPGFMVLMEKYLLQAVLDVVRGGE